MSTSARLNHDQKTLLEAAKRLAAGDFHHHIDTQSKEPCAEFASILETLRKYVLNSEQHLKQEIEHRTSTFLNISSHELRTPLTPMSAQLQMLMGGYYGKLNKEQQKGVEIIFNNARKLDKLIKDVLDISRIRADSMKMILSKASINELLKGIVAAKKPLAEEKAQTIKTVLDKTMPDFAFDADRLTQALSSIIENAIKFSPDKGTITITSTTQSNKAKITVKDNGIGIEKKNHKLIFEPFKQVDSSYTRKHEGTGLGLAIAKGIIQAHKGQIAVESEKGKGALFTITLSTKLKETPHERLLR